MGQAGIHPHHEKRQTVQKPTLQKLDLGRSLCQNQITKPTVCTPYASTGARRNKDIPRQALCHFWRKTRKTVTYFVHSGGHTSTRTCSTMCILMNGPDVPTRIQVIRVSFLRPPLGRF